MTLYILCDNLEVEMKDFFANIWTKRVVSVIAALYTVCVCFLCYYSVFYSIDVHDRTSVCLVVSGVSIIALVLMLYTRNQILTRISSFVILTAMLPAVLLYFDEKELLIPIVLTGVVILLLSGAGEGTKTVVGTMILLLYIFAALGYFLFTSFFVTVSKTTVMKSGESPSGRYRYSVINTEDSSGGSTTIKIEPNYADVKYPFVTFKLKNMEHVVYQERPICEDINLEWSTKSRQEITGDLMNISDKILVDLSASELEELGITKDNRLQICDIDIDERLAIGKTAQDVEPIDLDSLNEEQLSRFGIGRESSGRYYVLAPSEDLLMETEKKSDERVYLADLNQKELNIFCHCFTDALGYNLFDITKNNSVLLASLDDATLAKLGVSDSGDVLTFNGKICFRYYVAEIEDYFEVDSRKLSLDLLNS